MIRSRDQSVPQLDRTLLERHSSYVDDEIEERASYLSLSEGGELFSILYQPQAPRDEGFVVCHSYGLEFLTLRRTERAAGRALAALGYPVLAFHSRGYGDSSGLLAETTLDSQLDDLEMGVDHLRAETGVSRISLIGARFGALVAATAARRGAIQRLVLINPAFSGSAYFRAFTREATMVRLGGSEPGEHRAGDALRQTLADEGMVDVLGYQLYRPFFEQCCEVNLTKDAGAFFGSALVLVVTKGRHVPPREVKAYASLVEASGGDCTVAFVDEPPGVAFSGPAFVSTTDPSVRVDLKRPMNEHIARSITEWMPQ